MLYFNYYIDYIGNNVVQVIVIVLL